MLFSAARLEVVASPVFRYFYSRVPGQYFRSRVSVELYKELNERGQKSSEKTYLVD